MMLQSSMMRIRMMYSCMMGRVGLGVIGVWMVGIRMIGFGIAGTNNIWWRSYFASGFAFVDWGSSLSCKSFWRQRASIANSIAVPANKFLIRIILSNINTAIMIFL
ncbi:MAG: hypothetical protein GY696_31035 [Gammaproteobacteria bacterium]|nr:hypothetical protein [Gammaproteobacteria bacterium]